MQSTLELLDRALATGTTMPEWTRRLHVHRNALRNAKDSGHLTPVIAGNMAIELNEDPIPWMALAVLEGEKPSAAKDLLMKKLRDRVRKLYLSTISATRRVVGKRVRLAQDR